MMISNPTHRFARVTWLAILLILLSACGFKPRGSGYESVSGQKIFLSSENPYNQLERQLREKLKAYSMEIVDSAAPFAKQQSKFSYSGIRILSVDSSKRTLSVDSDGRPTEFETKITIELNFYFQNTQQIENKQFYAERDYRYDKNSSLAHDRELETIVSEMYEELGHRISTQFLRKLAGD